MLQSITKNLILFFWSAAVTVFSQSTTKQQVCGTDSCAKKSLSSLLRNWFWADLYRDERLFSPFFLSLQFNGDNSGLSQKAMCLFRSRVGDGQQKYNSFFPLCFRIKRWLFAGATDVECAGALAGTPLCRLTVISYLKLLHISSNKLPVKWVRKGWGTELKWAFD